MLLYNADVDPDVLNGLFLAGQGVEEVDDMDEKVNCRQHFFELRQRTLSNMDLQPAFRITAFGLLRKLRTNVRGNILYVEVEETLDHYFRLLDAHMKDFASLHDSLDAIEKQAHSCSNLTKEDAAPLSPISLTRQRNIAASEQMLRETMREIAVVLLACDRMQYRALGFKMDAADASAHGDDDEPAKISFMSFAEFMEEALNFSDQVRRKHSELQQSLLRATGLVTCQSASTTAEVKN